MKGNYLDSLTNLYSNDYLEANYSDYINKNNGSSMILIDFQKFKLLNDEHGHDIGDACLIAAAKQFKNYFPNSIVVRKGGDEFVIITNDSNEKITLKLECCLDSVRKDESVNFINEKIFFNCGIVDARQDYMDAFKKADVMMYLAKENNKHIVFFDNYLYKKHESKQKRLKHIDNLIDKNEIFLQKQDIVNLEDRKKQGVVLYSIDKFGLPLFEKELYELLRKNYRLKKIDILNINNAFNHVIQNDMKYMVNINYQTINSIDINFIKYLEKKIESTSVDPKKIIFSINVNGFDGDIKHLVEDIALIKKLGFNISLDNYSLSSNSLATNIWTKLDIDYVKLSRRNWLHANGNEIEQLKRYKIIASHIKNLEEFGTTPIFMAIENEKEHQFVKKLGPGSLALGKFYTKNN